MTNHKFYFYLQDHIKLLAGIRRNKYIPLFKNISDSNIALQLPSYEL